MIRTFILGLAGALALAGPALADDAPPATGGHAGASPEMLIDYWYHNYLHRAPDQGAAGWAAALNRGQAPEAILAILLSSQEYYAAGGGTPAGYVRELFHDLVRRDPTPRELDYWVRRLRLSSRRDVAYDLLTRYPQTWPGLRTAPTYVPGRPDPFGPRYPDPASRDFPDPGGPYFNGYEYRRPIRAFPLGSRG
jgi:hypothetical protein